ncbi:hypothetical protein [Nocardia sp. NPDC057668]|uniref:hypothetical protein n=1 Tax=Nocardia sp. NPDC057668 TaxID=3346202 RepID=UPI003671EE5D
MRLARALLILLGVALAWYGIALLLRMNPADLKSIALWFAGGILLHDAVFAPAAAALGLAGRRLLPTSAWGPLACGALCTVTLALIAVPVLGRAHAIADNPTILDRAYPLGLAVALAVIWSAVLLVLRGSAPSRTSKVKGELP